MTNKYTEIEDEMTRQNMDTIAQKHKIMTRKREAKKIYSFLARSE